MRGKNQRVIFIVLIAVLAGIGYFLHTYSQNSLRQKLTEQIHQKEDRLNRLLEANEGARAAADEAAAKEKTSRNEAKAAEAAREKSENDRKAAEEPRRPPWRPKPRKNVWKPRRPPPRRRRRSSPHSARRTR